MKPSNNSENNLYFNIIASLLLGYFGALLVMRIHLPPEVIAQHEPSFILFLNGKGPAPDQYRLIQNHLIGLLYHFIGFYNAILFFTALSLSVSIFAMVHCGFSKIAVNKRILLAIILSLLYPVLMYNGPRGDTAFIFLLSIALALSLTNNKSPVFFFIIISMAFTRADLAFFAVLFSLFYKPNFVNKKLWVFLLSIPLFVQYMLKYIIFPHASYYCDVVMVTENIKLERLLNTPMFYLISAVVLYYFKSISGFVAWLYKYRSNGKFIVLLFTGYVCVLFTVAIITEARLMLPLLPYALLLIEDYQDSKTSLLKAGI